MFLTLASLHDFQDVVTTQPDPESDLDAEAERQYHLQQSHAHQVMTVSQSLRDITFFNCVLGLFRD
jgi:hypothetical protein